MKLDVTKEMIGPGIEEEYDDAMERILVVEHALRDYPPTNETVEGRMVFQLKWFRQEIEAQRLPIPLEKQYRATLAYIIGDGSLNYIPGLQRPLEELDVVLEGIGLIKPRHYPIVIAMLEDLLSLAADTPRLVSTEQEFLRELRRITSGLRDRKLELPLDKNDFPNWKAASSAPNLSKIPEFRQKLIAVGFSVFSAFRPQLCRKGPLVPPNSGLSWGGTGTRVPVQ